MECQVLEHANGNEEALPVGAVHDAVVLQPAHLSAAQVEHWRRILRSRGELDSPFLRPEFALAVARTRDDARVGVLVDRRGHELGYFPFSRSRWRGAPIGLGRSNAESMIVPRGIVTDPIKVIHSCGLRACSLGHAVPDPTLRPFIQQVERCPIVDLSSGYEDYRESVEARRRRFFSELRRQTRRLQERFGPLALSFDEPLLEHLNVLMAWKSEQYRRAERDDRFAHQWNRELLRVLLTSGGEGFGSVLSVLRAGERIVAIHFDLRSDASLTGWFSAYDRELAKFSPGTLSLRLLIEEAFAHGVERFELGTGGESYKEVFANGEREYWRVRIAGRGARFAYRVAGYCRRS